MTRWQANKKDRLGVLLQRSMRLYIYLSQEKSSAIPVGRVRYER